MAQDLDMGASEHNNSLSCYLNPLLMNLYLLSLSFVRLGQLQCTNSRHAIGKLVIVDPHVMDPWQLVF